MRLAAGLRTDPLMGELQRSSRPPSRNRGRGPTSKGREKRVGEGLPPLYLTSGYGPARPKRHFDRFSHYSTARDQRIQVHSWPHNARVRVDNPLAGNYWPPCGGCSPACRQIEGLLQLFFLENLAEQAARRPQSTGKLLNGRDSAGCRGSLQRSSNSLAGGEGL